jgi:hypothetical protein
MRLINQKVNKGTFRIYRGPTSYGKFLSPSGRMYTLTTELPSLPVLLAHYAVDIQQVLRQHIMLRDNSNTHRPVPGINMNGSRTAFSAICLIRIYEAWYRGTVLGIRHRTVRKQACHINTCKYRLFELPYEANINIILTRCKEYQSAPHATKCT